MIDTYWRTEKKMAGTCCASHEMRPSQIGSNAANCYFFAGPEVVVVAPLTAAGSSLMVRTTLAVGRSLAAPAGPFSCATTLASYSGFDDRGPLGFDMDDLIATSLQWAEQIGDRVRRALLEVVHQQDALAALGQAWQ